MSRTGVFQATPIQSYNPAIDARNDISDSRRVQQPTVALDGRNFLFDSKGVKSCFGARAFRDMRLSDSAGVQGMVIAGKTFVFTQKAIMADWLLAYTFESAEKGCWSVVFEQDNYCLAHPHYGYFIGKNDPSVTRFRLTAHDATTIAGLPSGIHAMTKVRGRIIMVTQEAIHWGAVGAFNDFTPALGGAGFQLLSPFVSGEVLGVLGFYDGFIVLTSTGSVIAEHIGGDSVWRFLRTQHDESPLNADCVVRLSEGSIAILTSRGLKIINNRGQVQDWSEQFNLFIAPRTTTRFRMSYDRHRELLYISESADQTYVLYLPMGLWGLFNEQVHGFISLSANDFGYVRADGKVMRFTYDYWTEREPPNKTRVYARKNYVAEYGVSYAVSNALPSVNKLAGWYGFDGESSLLPSAPVVELNDSEILVGYLRPQQTASSVDGLLDICEVAISTDRRAAPADDSFITDWAQEDFFQPSEDWNAANGDEDWNVDSLHEDWNWLTGHEDWNVLTGNEDWETLGNSIDWSAPTSSLPDLPFSAVLESSEDGMTYMEHELVPSKFSTEMTLFGTLTSGTYHRLRVKGAYNITYLGITLAYGGQVM